MQNDIILKITNDMKDNLTDYQLNKLKESLIINFKDVEFVIKTDEIKKIEELEENKKLIDLFLSSKKIEGCSNRTIKYYEEIINKFISEFDKSIKNIDTDNIRQYLSEYKELSNCSSITIDNLRRVLSSFFSWLEDEDYIIKSPVRRIHKIKTATIVKETLTNENIEKLRDECENIRDLCLIELLISTGMRVGEIVNLNINDIILKKDLVLCWGKVISKEKYILMQRQNYIYKII